MKEKLSLVKFLENGQCPLCDGELSIIEMEISQVFLNKDGIPKDVNNMLFNQEAFCPKCKEYFKAKKIGMGFEIYSDLKNRLSQYRAEEKTEKLSANPFGR